MMNLTPYFKFKSMEIIRNVIQDDENYCDDDDLIGMINKVLDYRENVGYRVERIEQDNPREKAFFEQWLFENEPCSGVNNGQGILQDLFIDRVGPLQARKWIEVIQPRDRMIVATVIQWLGSNVGMSFLHSALRRFGASIVYDKKEGGQNG